MSNIKKFKKKKDKQKRMQFNFSDRNSSKKILLKILDDAIDIFLSFKINKIKKNYDIF
jgi:hypothetical protein